MFNLGSGAGPRLSHSSNHLTNVYIPAQLYHGPVRSLEHWRPYVSQQVCFFVYSPKMNHVLQVNLSGSDSDDLYDSLFEPGDPLTPSQQSASSRHSMGAGCALWSTSFGLAVVLRWAPSTRLPRLLVGLRPPLLRPRGWEIDAASTTMGTSGGLLLLLLPAVVQRLVDLAAPAALHRTPLSHLHHLHVHNKSPT